VMEKGGGKEKVEVKAEVKEKVVVVVEGLEAGTKIQMQHFQIHQTILRRFQNQWAEEKEKKVDTAVTVEDVE